MPTKLPQGTPSGSEGPSPRRPGGPGFFPGPEFLQDKIEAIRAKWGWFVVVGLLMILFGMILLGNLYAATVAVVWMTGVMLIIGGVVQIAQAFQARGWGHVIFWFISGLIYAAAGVIAMARPMVAADVFTLLFGITVIVTGGFRLIAALDARPAPGWGWMLFGGVITTAFGLLITAQWPGVTDWLLGLVLAVDLLSQGFTWLFFGLAIRKPR